MLRLPNELLAELLSWLSHPVDILSLARTSKFFCYKLVDPSASYMWRKARKACEPEPVPEPPAGHTEASWAAFLWGPNQCANCDKKTFELPWSYVWKLHMCKKCSVPEVWRHSSLFCNEPSVSAKVSTMLRAHGRRDARQFIHRLLPQDETSRWQAISYQLWFGVGTSKVLKKDCEALLRELEGLCELEFSTQALVLNRIEKRHASIHKRYEDGARFLEWSTQLESATIARERAVKVAAEAWANSNKIGREELSKSHTYRMILGTVKRQRHADILPLLDANNETLQVETTKIHERTEARALSEREASRCKTIDNYYHSRIVPAHHYHPPLKAFRSLPAVKSLIKDIEGADIKEALKSQIVLDLIESDVKQWISRTRNAVRRMLGYGDPRNNRGRGKASATIWKCQEGKLDPEERPTALFTCKICRRVETRCQKMGVLDFKALCRHECVEKDKSSRNKTPWDISNFEVAQRAKVAMSLMLNKLRIEDDDPGWEKGMYRKYWRCLNCPMSLGCLDTQTMIRHQIRHDVPNLDFQRLIHSREPERPFTFKQLKHNKHEATKKRLECIFCKSGSSYMDHANPRLMDFNGMICHLKAKHEIPDVRNEDYLFHELKTPPNPAEAQKVKQEATSMV